MLSLQKRKEKIAINKILNNILTKGGNSKMKKIIAFIMMLAVLILPLSVSATSDINEKGNLIVTTDYGEDVLISGEISLDSRNFI